MDRVKSQLVNSFEKIQFDTEIIFDELTKLKMNPQALQLRNVFTRLIHKKLQATQRSLKSSQSIEEFSDALNRITVDYSGLVSVVHHQIEKLRQGQDISDYIYQLKQESNDVYSSVKDRISSFLNRKED